MIVIAGLLAIVVGGVGRHDPVATSARAAGCGRVHQRRELPNMREAA